MEPACEVESIDRARGPATRGARQFRTSARAAGRAFLDLVFPPICLACETRISDHHALCPACWREIDFITPPLCDRLGLPLPYDIGTPMISAAAAAQPPVYDRARAVARHDGVMRDLVHTFKFRDSHCARQLFGRWLSEAGRDLIAEADLVLPVPLGRWRLLSRRFNQAQMLAAEIGRRGGKPVNVSALVRTRATAHQVGLSRTQRERNVAGAFAVRPSAIPTIAGKAILLVDDVVTTGATVSAAAQALKKAGASRVDVLALALVCETVS